VTTRLAVIHGDDLGMDYANHPAERRRHQLAVALAREAGVLAAPGVDVLAAPGPMGDEQLATMFAPAFIRAVKTFSATPILAAAPEARHWGITGDVHPYTRMHEDSARLAAAAWQAGSLVGTGQARRTIVPAGGAHHGLPHKANGFGIYNDTAVAIQALRGAGVSRIAYVDLDVHHGDGTQGFFWDDPQVLTVSVHESGRFLFPGTGFAHETGGAEAPGSAVNVALPPDAGDDAYRLAMAQVVEPAVRRFAPEVLVTQCGVDHHHADPLSHLLTTMPLYPELWDSLGRLADDCCDGRWVALAGGGYDPCNAPPRAWAMLIARMAGVSVPRGMPAGWAAIAEGAGCVAPATGWVAEPDAVDVAARAGAATPAAEEAVAATIAASHLLEG
jgi:acetoin utilization protein AcuC